MLYRSGVRKALEAYENIEVLAEAAHGQELLDKLEYLRPDVVITGIQMPVMDGMALVPAVRQQYPAVRIIVLSMINRVDIIEKVFCMGANAYLTKTANALEIYKAITVCTEQWLYLNDTLRNAIIKAPKRRAGLKEGFEEYELQILQLHCAGIAQDEISRQTDLSERTVVSVLERLIKETNTSNLDGLEQFVNQRQWF